MSAFIVDKDHIDAMVKFVVHHDAWDFVASDLSNRAIDRDLLRQDMLGQLLWDENYKSVNYRYHANDKPEQYVYNNNVVLFSAVDMIKACRCLAYQSCEHPEYESSEAHAIINAMVEFALRKLPGYEESPTWPYKG